VLTGARCSTDSGIPAYRSDAGEWKRARPLMLQDFLSDETADAQDFRALRARAVIPDDGRATSAGRRGTFSGLPAYPPHVNLQERSSERSD
jgi:hypothetical protein